MPKLSRAWRLLAGWRIGAVAGLAVYAVIALLASLLCLAEYRGIASEGYLGAGWLLLLFGLPLTAIESLLEAGELSFARQIVSLFVLALLNWLAIGALAGHLVGRASEASAAPPASGTDNRTRRVPR